MTLTFDLNVGGGRYPEWGLLTVFFILFPINTCISTWPLRVNLGYISLNLVEYSSCCSCFLSCFLLLLLLFLGVFFVFCLLFFFRPSQEYFTHMKTTKLLMRGRKFIPIFGIQVNISNEGSLTCHNYCVMEHSFIIVTSRNRNILAYYRAFDIKVFRYSYRSDHSPVVLFCRLSELKKGRGFWKFNNSLLTDKDYVLLIKELIRDKKTPICSYGL